MASAVATNRLRKELSKLHQDPPPGIIAEPKESDILTWFYAIRGPPDTPYAKGVYVGKLVFPVEYPMKPPGIFMNTPSGRFQIHTRLCLSMSDFHPESWNALWSVSSILQGIVSFMAGEELTTGGLKATTQERLALAKASHAYNQTHFGHLFDGDMDAAFATFEQARVAAAEKQRTQQQQAATSNNQQERESEQPTTQSTSTTSRKTTSSRGILGRRPVRRHQKKHPTSTNDDDDDDNQQDEETNNNNNNEQGSHNNQQESPELTAEEIEKRRKKNAKKKAKQKAKKAATANGGEDDA